MLVDEFLLGNALPIVHFRELTIEFIMEESRHTQKKKTAEPDVLRLGFGNFPFTIGLELFIGAHDEMQTQKRARLEKGYSPKE